MEKYDYTKEDIVKALMKVGIFQNDNILIHSNIGYFGKLKGKFDNESYCRTFKESIFEVIGSAGTLIVPTFSYSFCNNEIFDKNKTPSVCGIFSEFIRKEPQSYRSDDANFSVAAIGKNAEYFTKDMPEHSFGKNSFWERFLKYNGKLCRFNLDVDYNTFIHYVEKVLNVPYRHDKMFKGKSVVNGHEQQMTYYHFVRDLFKPSDSPDLTKFEEKAKKNGLSKTADLGRGQIMCISTRDTFELIKKEIKKHPNFLCKG